MPLKIVVRDADTGDEVDLELEPENTISEIIETVAGFWNKPAGAYVLKYKSILLEGQQPIGYYANPGTYGLKDGDMLELIPDPEGGC